MTNNLEQRALELLAAVDMRSVDREVMADIDRPCLYGVRGPCQHPRCLEVRACNVAAIRAIEAALRLSAGADWQPIETAPTTGIAVLLYQPWKSGRDCAVIGHYANGWVGRDCDEMQPEPTHWQPLPAAPRHDPDDALRGDKT